MYEFIFCSSGFSLQWNASGRELILRVTLMESHRNLMHSFRLSKIFIRTFSAFLVSPREGSKVQFSIKPLAPSIISSQIPSFSFRRIGRF